MPIYEYRCSACGHELEALQKISESPLTECPACHAATLTKKVSAAGFHLKGSGWYVTDFRNSGAKQPAKDAATKADKADAGAGKPEARPEAKSDSSTTESTTTTTKTGGSSETKSTTTTTSGDKTGS